MALEQFFSCPSTLARLQNGPLSGLLEEFCQWLIQNGFSRWTIRAHFSHLSHLNAYLGPASARPLTVVTAKDIEGFFRAYPLQCRNRGPLEQHLRYVRWAVDRFIDYLREKGVFEPSVSSPLYQPLLDAYRTWMQEERHVAAGTLALRCRSLSGFLRRLGAQATVEGLAHLTGDFQEGFRNQQRISIALDFKIRLPVQVKFCLKPVVLTQNMHGCQRCQNLQNRGGHQQLV